jgi:hypothetical protein
MRALVLALALLNVLFFGWSHWIDQPEAGRVSSGTVAALRLAPPPSKSVSLKVEQRCASIGPLTTRAVVAAVGTALRSHNLDPHERIAKGEAPDGYWVYIENLNDAQARARALKKLAQAGVRDAAALPSNGQVSVGLFSEKSGAELRATSVRAAGLEPIIKARIQLVDQVWYDVNSPSDVPLPTVTDLITGISVDTVPTWGGCATAAPPATVAGAS